MLALQLNQKLRGIVFFRTIFFMPVVFPLSLVSVVWGPHLRTGPQRSAERFSGRHELWHLEGKGFPARSSAGFARDHVDLDLARRGFSDGRLTGGSAIHITHAL